MATNPLLPLAAILVVVSAVTHLPFWVLIFFAGRGLFARGSRSLDRPTWE